MNGLPEEILELIVARVEDQTLAASIPRVCKLFHKFGDENGKIWILKSSEITKKYTIEGVNKKSDQQSWKQFYFSGTIDYASITTNDRLSKQKLILPNFSNSLPLLVLI
jgi:hypothetical protein